MFSFSSVKFVENGHVLGGQVEIEHISVLRDAGLLLAFRERNPIFLEAVPNQHLSWCLAVLRCDFDEGWVLHLGPTDQRAVCLQDNAVGMAVLVDIALLDPGVELASSSAPSSGDKGVSV